MAGHVVGGRYHLRQELGRGGMASVWRAHDTRLDRETAVKLLDPVWRGDPVALERFRREAQSVARLAHRNIVAVSDFEVADDAAYLVMELVEGRSVIELLQRHGPLPVGEAVAIAVQIGDALDAAHTAGLVHRDIKPSNILVGPRGVVKVCDFGLARLQRDAGAALTRTGTIVGTCHYMAPEQVAGEWVDGRCDLYALGCVLYTMLAGTPPFTGPTAIDVLDLHLNERPAPLEEYRDDLPAALRDLVGELLAKNRDDRPATARSVRDRLAALTGTDGLRADAGGPGETVAGGAGETVAGGAGETVVCEAPAGRHRAWGAAPLPGRAAVLVVLAMVGIVAAVLGLAGGGTERVVSAAPPGPAMTEPSETVSPQVGEVPVRPAPAPEPTRASPSPTRTGSRTAAPAPTPAPAGDQIAGLAAALREEAESGRLSPKEARTLLRDLDTVARRLDAGRTDAAAAEFADLRNRVSEILGDGALPGLGTLEIALDAAGNASE
jgi:hypothetical protein